MKDDPDVNIRFVGTIEANSCINDHNVSHYSNKHVTDNTNNF